MDLAIIFAPQKKMGHFDSKVLNTLAPLVHIIINSVIVVMVLSVGLCS